MGKLKSVFGIFGHPERQQRVLTMLYIEPLESQSGHLGALKYVTWRAQYYFEVYAEGAELLPVFDDV